MQSYRGKELGQTSRAHWSQDRVHRKGSFSKVHILSMSSYVGAVKQSKLCAWKQNRNLVQYHIPLKNVIIILKR